MNHLSFGVQKFESTKYMERYRFEYGFIKMNGGSRCDQIDRQGFKNEAPMLPSMSCNFEFCKRDAYKRGFCRRPEYFSKVGIRSTFALNTWIIGDANFQGNILLFAANC